MSKLKIVEFQHLEIGAIHFRVVDDRNILHGHFHEKEMAEGYIELQRLKEEFWAVAEKHRKHPKSFEKELVQAEQKYRQAKEVFYG